jgi:uncharacterized OB-fold protein
MNSSAAQRMLPAITEMNEYFWCGGKDGKLHILRCQSCGYWIHPYAGRCPECRSDALAPEAVSGRGSVAGFTVNYQPWNPGVPVPYVVAIVELEERADLRLMANMPKVPVEDVRIGLPVKVHFEPQEGGIFLPLFEKA